MAGASSAKITMPTNPSRPRRGTPAAPCPPPPASATPSAARTFESGCSASSWSNSYAGPGSGWGAGVSPRYLRRRLGMVSQRRSGSIPSGVGPTPQRHRGLPPGAGTALEMGSTNVASGRSNPWFGLGLAAGIQLHWWPSRRYGRLVLVQRFHLEFGLRLMLGFGFGFGPEYSVDYRPRCLDYGPELGHRRP